MFRLRWIAHRTRINNDYAWCIMKALPLKFHTIEPTSLRLRSQMSRLPSSEPATTHLPCTSVVEKAAKTQYLAFWWPAQARGI